MEEAVRIIERYLQILEKEGESSTLVLLYPKAVSAIGQLLSTVFSMKQSGNYQYCSPLLLLCASFLELEGMPTQAAALYLEAGDCLFAEGHMNEALECFLKSFKTVASGSSKTSKVILSMSLLMAAFTAMKLGGPSLLRTTVKKAKKSVNEKVWRSLKRTKYYALLQSLYQQALRPSIKKESSFSQVMDDLSVFSIGSSLKEWLQKTEQL